ncbi:MAG TPA: hypothetical protein VK503_00060 [Candidatus Bathyarchaeia archaeon]|nr:hypothetical protein [Candidatus Bathyarchaeia archaeon]
MRKALLVTVGAILMMGPSFLSKILIERLKLEIGAVAVGALGMFLIGTYLVLKFARD